MKGDLIIYKCDYPDFDPNVVQKWEEVRKSCIMFPIEWTDTYANEVKDRYGIPMEILCENYNFIKMKYDFGFSQRPYIKDEDDSYLYLTDGEKNIKVSKNILGEYINKKIKKYYVAKIEVMVNLGVSTTVHNFLWNDFIENRKTVLKDGCYYALTERQIRSIERQVSGLDLLKEYDKENPNLFVHISNNLVI